MTVASTTPSVRPDRAEILRALAFILPADRVTELRVIDASTPTYRGPHTERGYFDDPAKLASAAMALDGAPGIYVVLNEVDPALLARSWNRMEALSKKGTTTSDTHILRRRFLPIDFDAKRPAGISSSNAEHEAALERALGAREWLMEEMGFPEPVYADSGNGAHLLFAIDEPAEDDGLIHDCIHAIAEKWGDSQVDVDVTVDNPARIWKLYGTVSRKGDNIPDRPHRLSKIIYAPDVLETVPTSTLKRLAATCPKDPPLPAGNGIGLRKGEWIDNWLAKYRVPVNPVEPWGTGGRRWVFNVCPFNKDHTNASAFITENASGAIAAGCHHNGCRSWGWAELRKFYEPEAYAAQAQANAVKNNPAIGSVDTGPAQNTEADSVELAMIGAIFRNVEVIEEVVEEVSSGDFFQDDRCGTAFRAMLGIYGRGAKLDRTLLEAELRSQEKWEFVGGHDFIAAALRAAPHAANAMHYAAIVAERHLRSRATTDLTASLRELQESTGSVRKILDAHESRVFALTERQAETAAISISEVIHEVLEDAMDPKRSRGLPTGISHYDALTNGLKPGEYIILAGRPSHGKTALGVTIACHIAFDFEEAIPIGFFSLEMNRKQITNRVLCSLAAIDSQKLRSGKLQEDEMRRMSEAAGMIANGKHFIIDDTPNISAMQFRSRARRMVRRKGVRAIFLDYIQLMDGSNGKNRQEEVAAISRIVKATGRELNVPIFAMAQLNRASESENRMPRTSDLRESGALEQDADTIGLVHREAVARRSDPDWLNDPQNEDALTTAFWIIAKQREGPCDTVRLRYLDGQTRFVNYAPPGVT